VDEAKKTELKGDESLEIEDDGLTHETRELRKQQVDLKQKKNLITRQLCVHPVILASFLTVSGLLGVTGRATLSRRGLRTGSRRRSPMKSPLHSKVMKN
jgi:hypothetical protein